MWLLEPLDLIWRPYCVHLRVYPFLFLLLDNGAGTALFYDWTERGGIEVVDTNVLSCDSYID
jgi:hypothetical protein